AAGATRPSIGYEVCARAVSAERITRAARISRVRCIGEVLDRHFGFGVANFGPSTVSPRSDRARSSGLWKNPSGVEPDTSAPPIFQRIIDWRLADASKYPFGERTSQLTSSEFSAGGCSSVARSWPASESQRRTTPSQPPAAARCPSSESATAYC